VVVLAVHLQVQVETGGLAQRRKKWYQLGRQRADLLAAEAALEDEIRAPEKSSAACASLSSIASRKP
jgi:hypothetical protein